jgi:23S rRNA (guanine745-N1)-methyltransferase
MVTLICPVRHCGEPLERRDRAWVCSRKHSFDVARSGYCNLLQPQDRRSPRPGDPREAVEARRRLLDAGYGKPLLRALLEEIDALSPGTGATVLDVGCGEGTYLGEISRQRQVEAHGTDLSLPAIQHAARRYPEPTWIVANADRLLPYASGSFDLVLSIDARLNPEEMRRILRSDGRLLVAVPAPDDLIELREAVLGPGVLKDRMERAVASLHEHFKLESRSRVSRTVRLDPDAARDALTATYRGARASRRQRIEAISAMDVTLSHELARFRRESSTEGSA